MHIVYRNRRPRGNGQEVVCTSQALLDVVPHMEMHYFEDCYVVHRPPSFFIIINIQTQTEKTASLED